MQATHGFSAYTIPSGQHAFAGPPSPAFGCWFPEAAARIYQNTPARARGLGDDLVRLGDTYPYEVAAAHLGDDGLTAWRPTSWSQWLIPVIVGAAAGAGLLISVVAGACNYRYQTFSDSRWT
jgi:hypothetical protein